MKKNLSVILSMALVSLAQGSFAQTLFWDGGAVNITTNGDGISQGGAGTWDNTTENWDQGSGLAHTAWISGANAYFGGTNGVVTLNAAINANAITITNKGYYFTDGGNTGNALTVNTISNSTGGGTGTPTVMTNNVANSSTLNIWGANSDLRLDGGNASLSGLLMVNQGTVELGDGSAYNGNIAGSASIASGATLAIRNYINPTAVDNTFGGAGILEIENKSGVATILMGSSTNTGSTVIASGILIVYNMDDVNPNPIGTGPLQVGNNASAATFNYQGSTAFTTTRPLVLGGNGTSILSDLSGEPIIFNGPFMYGPNITATSKTLELSGVGYTDQGYSTLACNLTNYGTVPLILNKQSSTWLLAGSNSFSGGITFVGTPSQNVLIITNDFGLGISNGGIFLTNGSGTISSTNASVTIGASRMISVVTNATFSTLDTNNLTVASFITGAGSVTKGSSSYTLGVVRFSNDTNNFTGNPALGFGNTEFTSVADAGVPSSLGAGTMITNLNSTSYAIFRYVGANNSTTHRPLVWAGTTGPLALDNTNTGTIAYMSTAQLVTGSGAKTLTLQGSNTGTNTLAQVINDDGASTTVVKAGTGEWLLTGANTYSGATTVTGGTLLVNGSLSSGAVTVTNGGTLGGSGVIGGTVTVSSGGTLAAGDPKAASVATLTVNNSVTSSGTIFMKLKNGANDQLTGISTLVYGGTLSLTNLGGSLAVGNSFHLFSASSYQGGFASIAPATPGSGLAWNTNNLILNGTLSIVAGAPASAPVITAFTLSGNSLTIQATNGTANGQVVLLSSTNVTLALDQWAPVFTNTFNSSGNLNLTTNFNASATQEFFILSQ